MHELIKYEFDFEFDIPATYPTTAPEIKIPSLDGKTAKMYRGGSICLTVHFKPLWAKNRQASLLSAFCLSYGLGICTTRVVSGHGPYLSCCMADNQANLCNGPFLCFI